MNMIVNQLFRSLEGMFPGYFPGYKHNHYADFGWPTDVTFDLLYSMYQRNSVARAAVNKTVRKIWSDRPTIWMGNKDAHDETPLEDEIQKRFEHLRIWQKLATAERRGFVGGYAGVILRLADNKPFKEEADRVPGGLLGLVDIIPAWQGQLKVSQWYDNSDEPEYGQPKMFQFNEASVGSSEGVSRSVEIHPSRVIVWSEDGTVNGSSLLRAGFNDLMTMEKISGAGGQGFWKNAKSSPVLTIDKEARLDMMAQSMGVPREELLEKMNEQTEAWQKGFDQLLMLQGMEADFPSVTLPSPEPFYDIALKSFAGSVEMPVKILTGMQTGERASTEDAREWAQTCMGYRNDRSIPNIMEFVDRLQRFGVLPAAEAFLNWADLTESSQDQKIDRVVKMTEANSKNGMDPVFSVEEIREVAGVTGPAPEELDDEEDDVDPPNPGAGDDEDNQENPDE